MQYCFLKLCCCTEEGLGRQNLHLYIYLGRQLCHLHCERADRILSTIIKELLPFSLSINNMQCLACTSLRAHPRQKIHKYIYINAQTVGIYRHEKLHEELGFPKGQQFNTAKYLACRADIHNHLHESLAMVGHTTHIIIGFGGVFVGDGLCTRLGGFCEHFGALRGTVSVLEDIRGRHQTMQSSPNEANFIALADSEGTCKVVISPSWGEQDNRLGDEGPLHLDRRRYCRKEGEGRGIH